MGGSIEEFHDKATKKKLRNRLSAQRARDRQKARMHLLEMEVQHLMRRNLSLMRENEIMRRFLANDALNCTRALNGVGLAPSYHGGRNIVRCRPTCCNRARSNSADTSSTTEKHEETPNADKPKNKPLASYAIQTLGPMFHGRYVLGNPIPAHPFGVVHMPMINPWNHHTNLPNPADGSVSSSDVKTEKSERQSDLGDNCTAKIPAGIIASIADDDSSYTESSDEDFDETDEEESDA